MKRKNARRRNILNHRRKLYNLGRRSFIPGSVDSMKQHLKLLGCRAYTAGWQYACDKHNTEQKVRYLLRNKLTELDLPIGISQAEYEAYGFGP